MTARCQRQACSHCAAAAAPPPAAAVPAAAAAAVPPAAAAPPLFLLLLLLSLSLSHLNHQPDMLPPQYRKELLRADRRTVGRLDSRYVGNGHY